MAHADLSDADLDKSRPARSGSAGLILTALAWGSMLTLLGLGVPRFEQILKDFGVDLGWATLQVIHASHFVVDYAYFVIPMALGVVGLDAWHRDALGRGKGGSKPGLAWSLLMFGVPMAVAAGSILLIGWAMTGLLLKLT